MNAINIIYPRLNNGIWSFTDENVGLVNEPFVGETNNVISSLVRMKEIENPFNGFKLIFSENFFPEYDAIAEHVESDGHSGNYYTLNGIVKFWLCGALMRYFDKAPQQIYVKVESLK